MRRKELVGEGVARERKSGKEGREKGSARGRGREGGGGEGGGSARYTRRIAREGRRGSGRSKPGEAMELRKGKVRKESAYSKYGG